MLSFPKLTSVDLAVLSIERSGGVSEFPLLDLLLSQAPNLEHLALQVADTPNAYSPCNRVEEEQLTANRALILGPAWLTIPLRGCRIQALTLGGRANFDSWPQHIGPWIRGMDWSALTYLSLEDSHHKTVLESLQGEVPSLVTFKLGSAANIYLFEQPLPSTGDFLDRFLSMVPRLRHLSVLTEECPAWLPFLRIIYDRVAYNLHSFTAGQGVRLEGLPNIYWNRSDVEGLLLRAPALCELALQIDTFEQLVHDERSQAQRHDCSTMVSDETYPGDQATDLAKLSVLPELCFGLKQLARLRLAINIRYPCLSGTCLFKVLEGKRGRLDERRVKELIGPFFAAPTARARLEYVELIISLSNDSAIRWRVEARRKRSWAWNDPGFSLCIEFKPSQRWRQSTGRSEPIRRQYL